MCTVLICLLSLQSAVKTFPQQGQLLKPVSQELSRKKNCAFHSQDDFHRWDISTFHCQDATGGWRQGARSVTDPWSNYTMPRGGPIQLVLLLRTHSTSPFFWGPIQLVPFFKNPFNWSLFLGTHSTGPSTGGLKQCNWPVIQLHDAKRKRRTHSTGPFEDLLKWSFFWEPTQLVP